MGERGGFLKYGRIDQLHLSVDERIKNWDEFYIRQTDKSIKQQAARCMECGTPFCHTGNFIGGLASGCPLHNLIPEWNDLIYKGLWKEAYNRLSKTIDFPEFTGRVCPALCEGACTAGLYGNPVTIKNNENEIIERAFGEGMVVPDPPLQRTSKNIAVIGSGPAGLTCANQLNKLGHNVKVFEREDRPGGLLMYGIPNMKLDKEKVLMRRIEILKKEGIVFVLDTDVGKDISLEELNNRFDAVVLCIGSTKPRDLKIKGRDLKGIYFAVDFLTENNRNVLSGEKRDRFVSANGRNVIVIGGGDTGTDCVATSIRQGCKSVIQLEIMSKPLEFRHPSNPWPEWPKVLKIDYGQEEAIELYGKDPRQYLSSTTEAHDDGSGNVSGLSVINVEWIKDEEGRHYPREIIDSKRVLKADLILLAMGFLGPEDYFSGSLPIERDSRSNIKTENGSYETNVKGIFAAGDARRGQSLVVWAILEGRKVAEKIDKYLNNI